MKLPDYSHSLFDKIADCRELVNIQQVSSYINQLIDFDESQSLGRVVIKSHIDEELDEMKSIYNSMNSLLSNVANNISSRLKISAPLSVVYFPQLGYLIGLPKEFSPSHGLAYMFSTDQSAYYKNEDMEELDNELGDIHSNIVDKETEHIQQLREFLLGHGESFRLISDDLAELDCMLSMAEVCFEYGYTRPEISDDDEIQILQGRHPIIDQCVDFFVPNDTLIRESVAKSIVVTGANSSGKSIYITQVALIVYMTHIGFFVPAQYAKIGLTDSLFSCLQTKKSVSLGSSFCYDLNTAWRILERATPKTLVLLDEFGQGTANHDGIALSCTLVKYLTQRKCRLLITTHYQEIASYGYLTDAKVDFFRMEVDQNVYLFKLTKGAASESNSIQIARKVGFDSTFIERLDSLKTAGNKLRQIHNFQATLSWLANLL
jgi:DNA mismatch repair protein MSH5